MFFSYVGSVIFENHRKKQIKKLAKLKPAYVLKDKNTDMHWRLKFA